MSAPAGAPRSLDAAALREHREELLAHLDEDVVLELSGGIVAWEQSGGRVRRGEQRWELERQVRLVAGSIVLLLRLPYNRSASYDVRDVMEQLADAPPPGSSGRPSRGRRG